MKSQSVNKYKKVVNFFKGFSKFEIAQNYGLFSKFKLN